MRVLLSTSDCDRYSGAFRSTVALASELRMLGWEPIVLVPRTGSGIELLTERDLGHRVVRSWNWTRPLARGVVEAGAKWTAKRLLNRVSAVPTIRRLCRDEGVDVVHVCTTHTYVAAVAALCEGLPLVWHLREFLEEDQGAAIDPGRAGYDLIARSDRAVAISEAIAEKYLRLAPGANVDVIYNGVSSEDLYDPVHEILVDEVPRMCIVGTIKPQKGQADLLRALALARGSLPGGFRLSVVGSDLGDGYEGELRALSRDLGIEDLVFFDGPSRDPGAVFSDSDITFMCSTAEAFGRVTVEGMMGGSLVIGANAMGTGEIIEDGKTGLLYAPGDVGGLADKIVWAVSDPERARVIARAGRNHAMLHFTAERNARDVAALYAKVLKERHLTGKDVSSDSN